MTCIEFGKRRLRADGENWIVEQRAESKDDKVRWVRPRYYGSLGQACGRLLDDGLRDADAASVQELVEALETAACAITRAVLLVTREAA